jgi:hypothetical protein
LQRGAFGLDALAVARVAPADDLVDEAAIGHEIGKLGAAAQQECIADDALEMAVRNLDGAVLMGEAAVVARGLHAVVGAQRVVAPRQILARLRLQVAERRRQAVTAVLARGTTERPQRVLQPLGQRHVALATEDHVRVLEARTGETEVVQAVVQSNTGHRDAQAVHLGEVGQAHATRLVHLAEDDVALFAMDGAPAADASLERSANPGRQLRVAPHHLLEHGHRPHARCRREQRNHFGLEDLGQRIRSASLAWRLLLRRQARVLLDAIRRGHAEPGTCCRLRRPFGQSELHVEPHLVVVDVSSGHERAPDNARYPLDTRSTATTDEAPWRQLRRAWPEGLRATPGPLPATPFFSS